MSPEKFTILYVDDEANNLFSFKAAFRKNYHILTAESGEEGLEIIKREPVHIIVTDQRMPGMTGVQFLEKVFPTHPEIISMILTGFSDVQSIIEAINTGQVFRYITKPWNENELRMTLENARELFQLRQANFKLLADLKAQIGEQDRILDLFKKYVPQPVIDRAIAAGEEEIFAGELREVAVLFCEIIDFHQLTADLDPQLVVSFLNEYYREMTELVKSHQGMVNQFVGPEVFATFGAPESTGDDAGQATQCALLMLKKHAELADRYKDKFGTSPALSIGINYGEVVAGNLGSDDRIEYSVTGDVVNTGKRVQTLGFRKEHHNALLANRPVLNAVNGRVAVNELEPQMVKGKKEPIEVGHITDWLG